MVWLEGAPRKGVGPHDVAISLVKAVFENGFVKNKVLEFAGPGVKNLPIDFEPHQNYFGCVDVPSVAKELLHELTAAFTDAHITERTVTRVAVRS